jgi:hypothetical protein
MRSVPDFLLRKVRTVCRWRGGTVFRVLVYALAMRRSSRRCIAAGAIVASALGAGISAFAGSSAGGNSGAEARVAGRCVGGSGETVAFTVPMPGKPGATLLSKQTLWVAINGARAGQPGLLVRLDARTGRVQARFRLPIDPLRLAEGFGSLWVTGQGGDRRYRGVLRLDPRSGRLLSVVRASKTLGAALATTANAVWVGGGDVYPRGHEEKSGVYYVYKIDPYRNAVVRRFRLRSTVIDLVGARESLWTTGWYAVAKLSESGQLLYQQRITGSAWSITPARDGVWAAHTFYGSRKVIGIPPAARELLRIRDAAEPHLAVLNLDASPWLVSAAAGVVWMALDEYSHGVQRVRDARIPANPTAVAVPGLVRGVQSTPDGAWVVLREPNQLAKIC